MQTNQVRGLIGAALALVCFQCVASTAQATALWPVATVDNGNFTNSNLVTPPFPISATAAVHFYSSNTKPGTDPGSPVTGTFEGIAFNNLDINTGLTGSIALNANSMPGNPHLTYNFYPGPNIQDATGRNLGVTTMTGPDSGTITAATGNGIYLAAASANLSADLTFTGLLPSANVYVQILGGLDGGWGTSHLNVKAIGATTATGSSATWTQTERGVLGFYAETNTSGSLDLQLSIPSNFLGIGAVLVSESVPEPSSFVLAGLALAGSLVAIRRRRAVR